MANAETISNIFINELQKFSINFNKIISLEIYGAAVMSGDIRCVYTKLNEMFCKNVSFVHSFIHK